MSKSEPNLVFKADDFPGVETLLGKDIVSEIEVIDVMLNALLIKAAELTDPLKRDFLETICKAGLGATLLDSKTKAYVCAVGGLKDNGRLQDFMRYTTALLKEADALFEVPPIQ